MWSFLRDGLQREKDFSNSSAGIFFLQSNTDIILGKSVLLRIVTIFILYIFYLFLLSRTSSFGVTRV